MGKGGGCFPSKNRAPSFVESDPDPAPIPAINDNRSIPIEQIKPPVEIRKLRIFIVFYSMYGHVESLARNIKKGVEEIEGVESVLFRVPETLSAETLTAMRVPVKGDDIPEISAEELVETDGLLFGFPMRYWWIVERSEARRSSGRIFC
ncbi:hypothetical protein L1987_08398 [Smallanthus sonchifolius]|uniref:Uncharacterized protein n=1 Tax=Smallanthus sonchifolius TaxID=185202 RepID=A0ACB9JMF8_9ASTR|nr:hypothetical protein L1987_08398 [Smallanthus sonchifolius]